MLDQPFGFYIGFYIYGVGMAILIHKVYFALHPELKWENIEKDMQGKSYDPCKNVVEQGCLHDLDEEQDMFTPLSDQSIKMMIWLS